MWYASSQEVSMLHAQVLKVFRGPLTEGEQESIVAIQQLIREVIENRCSLVRTLAAIGLRLEERNTDNDLLIVAENIEFELPELKAADQPLKTSEEVLLEDIDAFIQYCAENGLRYDIMRHTLLHDVHGILEKTHGQSRPGYPRFAFGPRVSGYSNMDWDAWASDSTLQDENAAINREFKSSEMIGL
jgi:hypothetical protein